MERTGGALAQIMSELVRRAPAQDAPVMAWPAVCGQVVAERTRALQFSAGRLRVEVPDAAWGTQLAELEARYKGQFKSLLGHEKVRHIEFVTAGHLNSSGPRTRTFRA